MKNVLEYTCSSYNAGRYVIHGYWDGELEEKFLYSHCDCGGSQCKFYKRNCPDLPLCKMVVDLDVHSDFRFSDYAISKEEKEKKMKQNFTKDMLRTYHIVKFENGTYGTLYKDSGDDLVIVYGDGNYDLVCAAYSSKMKARVRSKSYDIVQVYKVPTYAFRHFWHLDTAIDTVISMCELIWERHDKKEMTIAEIEKELGYSIKIVKEEVDG